MHTEYRRSLVSDIHNDTAIVIPHGTKSGPGNATLREIQSLCIPGIVRPIKGHVELVKAVPQLPSELTIQIVDTTSDKTYEQKAEDTIDRLGVPDRGEWTNRYVPGKELMDAIDEADLIVLSYEKHTSASRILSMPRTVDPYSSDRLPSFPLYTRIRGLLLGRTNRRTNRNEY